MTQNSESEPRKVAESLMSPLSKSSELLVSSLSVMAEYLDHQQESSQVTTLEFRPGDETNPRNWLIGQKLYASLIPILICFAMYVSSLNDERAH